MGIIQDMMARSYQLEDRKKRSASVTKLIGEQGWEQAGPMPQQPDGLLEQRPTIGGSGLMGGAGQFDAQNRSKFATGLLNVPGMENIGAQLMNNNNRENMLNKQFGITQAIAQQNKNAWTPKDILSATTAQQTQFNKENKGYRNTLAEFNNTTNLIQERGGFKGLNSTDQLGMVNSFIKTLRPNEVINEGDFQAVLNASGYTELGNRVGNLITGGSLTDVQVEDMYGYMELRAKEAAQQGTALRDMTAARLQGTPLKGSQVMQPQIQFNPYQSAPQSAPAQGQVNRFTPEQQRFVNQTGRQPASDGTIMAVPPGVPFEHPDYPGKMVVYDDAGGLLEYQ